MGIDLLLSVRVRERETQRKSDEEREREHSLKAVRGGGVGGWGGI